MKTTLRPLTGPEQEAVLMLQDGKPMDVIERETGLRRAEIVAADDLSKQWGTLAQSANGSRPPVAFTPVTLDKATLAAPPKPVTPTFQAAKTAPTAESSAPTAAKTDPIPDTVTAAILDAPPVAVEIDVPVYARGDASAVLSRAEQSADPKMRAEALAIRGFIADLETSLDRGEKALAAQAKVDELRERLAQAERELAELDGEAALTSAPSPSTRKPETDIGAVAQYEEAGSVAEPAPTASAAAKPKSGRGGGDPMAYNETVRAWARRKGLKVGMTGRMSMDVVNLFKAEHPPVNA